MRILGAIIAGGKSRRFGSDKAALSIAGLPLLEQVHQALVPQVDEVVVCGRDWQGMVCLADVPCDGLGPLGGLAGAMCHAQAQGFDAVLSVPVDTFPLPGDLVARLQPLPAAFAHQYLIGLWPAALAMPLEHHLAQGHRSVRSWIAACDCTLVEHGAPALTNINHPRDAPA